VGEQQGDGERKDGILFDANGDARNWSKNAAFPTPWSQAW
jgi:hypothetical protein